MNLLKSIALLLLVGFFGCESSAQIEFKGKTLTIPSADGIEITAEYYEVKDTKKPLILLFHQAGYSRGEYREIAPKLNDLGFSCLAIDQRSGNEVNGIKNLTNQQAKQKGLGTTYPDAYADLKATIDFVLDKKMTDKVILLGSSYSASLVFILGSEYSDEVVGIVSFSPGEYFKYKGKAIEDYAKNIECPVFITSAGNEKKNWSKIYDNIKGNKIFYLPKTQGKHGAKALWKNNSNHKDYWTAFKGFLEMF